MKKTLLIASCLGVLLGTTSAVCAEFTDSVRFFIIEEFLVQGAGVDSEIPIIDPTHSLARFLVAHRVKDTLQSPAEWFINNPDPLRVPNPFNTTAPRSTGLLARTTTRLRQYGISFDISSPADFTEAEQSVAKQISRGHPVVAIHPHPYVLFGYDYREPDPFWYITRFSPDGRTEIITRSAWRADWWLWEPDPTSVILLVIDEQDSVKIEPLPPQEVFANLLSAAKTDTATGIVSYIRPILRMIDSLAEAITPPEIIQPPEDNTDPLYLRRAEIQRLRLHEYFKSLTPRARNSEVQQNLRLATYSASKAAGEFAAARLDMYGDDPTPAAADTISIIERINQRWLEHHLDAADHLTEVIRWERQMLAALRDIVAEDRPFHE